MIFWEEYKKLKVKAEKLIKLDYSDDFQVDAVLFDYHQGFITREKAVEDLIDVLSGGEHYKPL